MAQWGNDYGGDGGGGAGGFYADNNMSTPGGQSASKPAARQQFLAPLTVRQVIESPEDGMRVGPLTVNMVTLAGIVVDVDVTSTTVKFTLSDDTGTIECVEWLETEDGMDPRQTINLMPNAYYQVYGVIKSPQGRKRITVFKVIPIEDFNDYVAFMAEVVSFHQYAQRVNSTDVPMGNGNSTTTGNTNNYNNAFNNSAAGANNENSSFTPVQKAVIDAIKSCNDQVGWNKRDSILKNKFGPKQIEDAVDFLIGEGHIYSTIDDDHFLST